MGTNLWIAPDRIEWFVQDALQKTIGLPDPTRSKQVKVSYDRLPGGKDVVIYEGELRTLPTAIPLKILKANPSLAKWTQKRGIDRRSARVRYSTEQSQDTKPPGELHFSIEVFVYPAQNDTELIVPDSSFQEALSKDFTQALMHSSDSIR